MLFQQLLQTGEAQVKITYHQTEEGVVETFWTILSKNTLTHLAFKQPASPLPENSFCPPDKSIKDQQHKTYAYELYEPEPWIFSENTSNKIKSFQPISKVGYSKKWTRSIGTFRVQTPLGSFTLTLGQCCPAYPCWSGPINKRF